MGFYRHHLLVCTNRRDNPARPGCGALGGEEAWQRAKAALRAAGPQGQGVQVSRTGCLGRCELGPVAVVYPEGIWYRCSPDDVELVVQQHLLKGHVVEALRITDDESGA
jgi:(2Fe-2S) ferredoxin